MPVPGTRMRPGSSSSSRSDRTSSSRKKGLPSGRARMAARSRLTSVGKGDSAIWVACDRADQGNVDRMKWLTPTRRGGIRCPTE
jgi:hypothetical protein